MNELQNLYNKLKEELIILKNKSTKLETYIEETNKNKKEKINDNASTKSKLEKLKKEQETYINQKMQLLKNILKSISSLAQIITIIICVIFSYYLSLKLFPLNQIGQIIISIPIFISSTGLLLTIENKLLKKITNYYTNKINQSIKNKQILSSIKKLEQQNTLEKKEISTIENLLEKQLKQYEIYQKEIKIRSIVISYIEKEVLKKLNKNTNIPEETKRIQRKKQKEKS